MPRPSLGPTCRFALLFGSLLAALAGCDKESAAPTGATTAPAASEAPAPPASATATQTASAPAPAPAAQGNTHDVMIVVRDPTKEPEKTVKVDSGGTLTLFLPDYAGTQWSVADGDKALGKAQEEVAPGFAPGTNGHQFKWALAGKPVKAGQKLNAHFVNKKAGDKTAKPTGTFAMTIEIL